MGKTGLVKVMHVDNPLECELASIAPQFSRDDGIVKQSGEMTCISEQALLERREFYRQ